MSLAVSITALVAVLLVLARELPPALLSPVYALLVSYAIVFSIGGLAYNPAFGGASVKILVSNAEIESLSVQISWLLSAFAVGVYIAGRRAGRKSRSNAARLQLNAPRLTNFQANMLIVFAGLAVITLVLGTGIESTYSRSEYLHESNHTLKIIGTAMLPGAALACGAAANSRNTAIRGAGLAMGLFILLLAASLCTREFCLVPALFFTGSALANPKKLSTKVALVLSLVGAPLLITVPLTGRGLAHQGLSALPELATEVVESESQNAPEETINNIFIAEPLTIASMKTQVWDSVGYVRLGTNPLPGFMTTWEESERRINAFTPCNAVGDLLRAGLLIASTYYLALGFYFGHVEHKVRDPKCPNSIKIPLIALSYLFTVVSLQYPLRNATRLVYYMMAIELVAALSSVAASFMIQNPSISRSKRKQRPRNEIRNVVIPHAAYVGTSSNNLASTVITKSEKS